MFNRRLKPFAVMAIYLPKGNAGLTQGDVKCSSSIHNVRSWILLKLLNARGELSRALSGLILRNYFGPRMT